METELTAFEHELTVLIASGLQRRQIADELDQTEEQINGCILQLLRKLQLSNPIELIFWAATKSPLKRIHTE